MLAGDCCQLLDGIEHTSRCFGMNERDDIRTACRERLSQLVWVARAPPFHVETGDGCAISFTDLRQPIAKVTSDDDDDAGRGLYKVGDRRLHPTRPSSRHHQ